MPLSYMEPFSPVSRGTTGEGDTGMRDYRNLWRVGSMFHRRLFYRCSQKREYQLEGRRLFSGKSLLYRFPGERFIAGFSVFSHGSSIKPPLSAAVKGGRLYRTESDYKGMRRGMSRT